MKKKIAPFTLPPPRDPVQEGRNRREATDLRAENKRLAEAVAGLEDRLEQFTRARELAKQLPPIKGARKGRVLSTDRREATAVALASDWHVGEKVDPSRVMGLNEFTPEIARLRARRYFEAVEWLITKERKYADIQNLVLALMGDFLSGYIHAELVESNFMSPIEEVRFTKALLIEGIDFLLRALPDLVIRIPCNFGNHDRTTDKTRIATASRNSYTWGLYHDLADWYRGNERVLFQIADGHHLVTEIYDLRLHTHHGDSVRSAGGIGGVTVPLNRAVVQWAAKYNSHISCVGHFHQYLSAERLVMNGSLIGYSTYADWLPGAAPEPAQQAFFLVDRKRGKTAAYKLWVQEA